MSRARRKGPTNATLSRILLNKMFKRPLRKRSFLFERKNQRNTDDSGAKVQYAIVMNLTSKAKVSALIAAHPGLMRDALQAFLQATRDVHVIALVDDAARILEAVRQHQPHTLVIDIDLSQESLVALVQQFRVEWPGLNCVVLVNTLRQQQIFLAAGARHVLLKGQLDERLQAAVVSVPANVKPSRSS